MGKILLKIVKCLIIGTIIFLVINYIDKKEFYDYHGIVRSHLIGFYFYPLLLVADLINSIVPIADTLVHKVLLNPHYFSFSQVAKGDHFIVAWQVGTMILGSLWTAVLVWGFSLIPFKKWPTLIRIIAYVLLVVLVTFVASGISILIFGAPYFRLCPNCP